MRAVTSPSSSDDDVTDEDLQHDLTAALALGRSQPVGGFRLDLASSRWTWSKQIYTMHGFAPGEVVPSTEFLLAHKHPDDRQRVSDVLDRACRHGAPFSTVHRIIDAQGRVRVLGIIGQGRRDAEGRVVELVGYFVDLSESHREAADRRTTEYLAAVAAGRASIEQAKGILMAGMHVSDDEAFAVLRRMSNDTNVPLRELAREFVVLVARGPEPSVDGVSIDEAVPRRPTTSRPRAVTRAAEALQRMVTSSPTDADSSLT